jgi:hypothetical protein
MTSVPIASIEDPLRPGVCDVVPTKMRTGENVLTTPSIAIRCSIRTVGGATTEGTVSPTHISASRSSPVFRSWPSSPPGTIISSLRLSILSVQITSATNDDTNDGPTLETTNVGSTVEPAVHRRCEHSTALSTYHKRGINSEKVGKGW